MKPLVEYIQLALQIDAFANDSFLQYYDMDHVKGFIPLRLISKIELGTGDDGEGDTIKAFEISVLQDV